MAFLLDKEERKLSGKLYVVGTPIGNLSDISFRAIEVLQKVDIIACEDTRVTQKLLSHYKIKKSTISYHQHSKIQKLEYIIEKLIQGKEIALVTDAGTPGISDPARQIVNQAREKGIEVIAIPGPSALTAALSISGLDTREFVFYGFLPHKKGRQKKLKEIAKESRTIVIYESVHRIRKLLSQLLEFVGDREVCVCRELTKQFETVYRGKITEISDKIVEKGEFVVIIEGKNEKK